MQGPVGACDSFQRDKGSTMTEKMDWLDKISTVLCIIGVVVILCAIVIHTQMFIKEIRMSDEERVARAERHDAESLSNNVKSMCIEGKKFVMTREYNFLAPDSWNAVQVLETDEKGKMNAVPCGK